jgi:hypothetical protein
VRAAGQQLEQLKGSVVAAQQQHSPEDGGGAAINEHTAAHLHGVVSAAAAQADIVAAAAVVAEHLCLSHVSLVAKQVEHPIRLRKQDKAASKARVQQTATACKQS